MRKLIRYFSLGEWLLWSGSCLAILIFFFLFDGSDFLTLIASLIGVTSLIFCAKGNPAGQVLMILFSLAEREPNRIARRRCIFASFGVLSLARWS